MSWGGRSHLHPARNYPALLERLSTPRRKQSKGIGSDTSAVLHGTFESPLKIAIRLYSTNILNFYPDGSMSVSTDHWCTSDLTCRRFAHYGIHVYRKKLPTVNGRLPNPTHAYFLHYKGQCVAFNTGKSDSGIDIRPDGTIDMSTVRPHEFEVVKDPKPLRQMALQAGKIYKQLKIRRNLGVKAKVHHTLPAVWIMQKVGVPLDAIDYFDEPAIPLYGACPGLSYAIRTRSRLAGNTETRQVLTL